MFVYYSCYFYLIGAQLPYLLLPVRLGVCNVGQMITETVKRA